MGKPFNGLQNYDPEAWVDTVEDPSVFIATTTAHIIQQRPKVQSTWIGCLRWPLRKGPGGWVRLQQNCPWPSTKSLCRHNESSAQRNFLGVPSLGFHAPTYQQWYIVCF